MPRTTFTPEYVAGYIQSQMHGLDEMEDYLNDYSELTAQELYRLAEQLHHNNIRVHEQMSAIRGHPEWRELNERVGQYEERFQPMYRAIVRRVRHRERYESSEPVNMAAEPTINASTLYRGFGSTLAARYVASDDSLLASTDEEDTGRQTPPEKMDKRVCVRRKTKKIRPEDLDPYATDARGPIALEHMSIVYKPREKLSRDDLRQRLNQAAMNRERRASPVSLMSTPASSAPAVVAMARHDADAQVSRSTSMNAKLSQAKDNSRNDGEPTPRVCTATTEAKKRSNEAEERRARSRSPRPSTSTGKTSSNQVARQNRYDDQEPCTSNQARMRYESPDQNRRHELPRPARRRNYSPGPVPTSRRRYTVRQQWPLEEGRYEGPLPPVLSTCPRRIPADDPSIIGLTEFYVINKVNYRDCPMCGEEHKLIHCHEFEREPFQWRWWFALTKGLCLFCLTLGHSHFLCRKVDKKGRDECALCWVRHNKFLCPKDPDNKM